MLSLSECNTWYYQLQGVPRVEDVRDVDLLVIDIDEDPTPFLDGQRQVAAYLSIGEAEDYRVYFKSFPRSLLFPENPQWKGNYPVHFWSSYWQDIILARAKEAQAKGFTALYLDKVDVVNDIADRWPGEAPTDIRMRMYVFMMKIREAVPGMAIIQQNAEDMLPLTQHVIDGVGVEDLYLGETTTGEINDPKSVHTREDRLAECAKPVFVVEYTDDPHYARLTRERCEELSWVAFIADPDRSLSG